MLEVGWSEMLVIAVVMIVVVGPKDLPRMLRTFGRTTAKLRTMAGDFQKQFNEALQEAELDDVKKSVDTLRGLNPAAEIRKQLNPFEKAAADVRSGLDTMMKPSKPAPAAAEAQAAVPLKNGATEMPGTPEPVVTADALKPDPAAPPPPTSATEARMAAAEAAKAQAGPPETAQPAKPAKASAAPAKSAPKAAAKPKAAAAKKPAGKTA